MQPKSLRNLTVLTATTAIAAGAIALGLGAAAFAQTGLDSKRGERGRTQMFERLDTDKDGKVTKAEFGTAHAARFKAADKDGDGFVTKEEFAAYGLSLRGEFVDRMFARLDKNGDGKLTADEMKSPRGNRADREDRADRGRRGEGRGLNVDRADAAKKGFVTVEDLTKFRTERFEAALKKRFERLDTNRDGKLAGDEIPAERKNAILRADADKDGAVTFAEFTARPREMLVRRVQVEFKALDADGDGKITKAEAEAARGKPMLLLVADANKDGVVTKEELAKSFAERRGARAGNPVGERFFAALDTDKDGKISTAEWNASGDRRFARLDRNHDGVVTVEETSRRGRDGRGRK